MAQIVLGVGTSHSPQLSTPPENWPEGPDRFKRPGFELHAIPGGQHVSFEELAAQAPPEIARDINPATFERRYDECQKNLAWLAEVIANAKPDLLEQF